MIRLPPLFPNLIDRSSLTKRIPPLSSYCRFRYGWYCCFWAERCVLEDCTRVLRGVGCCKWDGGLERGYAAAVKACDW